MPQQITIFSAYFSIPYSFSSEKNQKKYIGKRWKYTRRYRTVQDGTGRNRTGMYQTSTKFISLKKRRFI